MRKRGILKYIVVVCIIGVVIFLAGIVDRFQPSQSNEMESLAALRDYPELFEKDVIIVVGENATGVEKDSAVMIKENLKELTGDEPTIKNDTELSELEKKTYDLILIGTPTTNHTLQEVYRLTGATRVTNEYPGESKGILEILENPWNLERVLLIVAGSDEWGMKAGSELLKYAQEINKNNVVVEWKDSKAVFARTIPRDKYIFLETERRIEIEPRPPRLMIEQYPLTYYFDEISGNLEISAMGGLSVKGKLTINDDLLVLIGNTIVIEKVIGSGRGIMPPVYSIPFSSQKEDLDFLEIIYLESNGTAYLRYKGKKLVLESKEQYETSFREDEAVHTLTIENHGFLDKEKIIVE